MWGTLSLRQHFSVFFLSFALPVSGVNSQAIGRMTAAVSGTTATQDGIQSKKVPFSNKEDVHRNASGSVPLPSYWRALGRNPALRQQDFCDGPASVV